jgi:hypothetical protein
MGSCSGRPSCAPNCQSKNNTSNENGQVATVAAFDVIPNAGKIEISWIPQNASNGSYIVWKKTNGSDWSKLKDGKIAGDYVYKIYDVAKESGNVFYKLTLINKSGMKTEFNPYGQTVITGKTNLAQPSNKNGGYLVKNLEHRRTIFNLFSRNSSFMRFLSDHVVTKKKVFCMQGHEGAL